MFTTFPKDPTELFKVTSDYFKAFPKNESEVKDVLMKLKSVFDTEAANTKDMWQTYQKSLTGDATLNEIAAANKKAEALLITTRFAFIMAIPGSVFMLPLIIEMAEKLDIDLIPASIEKEFGIN